jgi:hypothetical protein
VADSTEVVPEAVLAFGTATQGQVQPFVQSVADEYGRVQGAALGVSGMTEGVAAREAYGDAVQELTTFIDQVRVGLTSLSYAAATVAHNYRNGDTEQSEQMASVTGALRPPDGAPSIRQQTEAARAAAAADERERQQFAHRTGESYEPTPTWMVNVTPSQAGRADSDSDSTNDYMQYRDAVDAHNAALGHGDGESSNPEDYSPTQEQAEAEEDAERLTEATGVDWEVETDRYGESEVVRSDPSQVPRTGISTGLGAMPTSPSAPYPAAGSN